MLEEVVVALIPQMVVLVVQVAEALGVFSTLVERLVLPTQAVAVVVVAELVQP